MRLRNWGSWLIVLCLLGSQTQCGFHETALPGNRPLGDLLQSLPTEKWLEIDTELDFCHFGDPVPTNRQSIKYSQEQIESEIKRLQQQMASIPEVDRILFQFGGTLGASVSFVDNRIARGVNGWMAGDGKILLNADLLFTEEYHLIVTYVHELIHHYQFLGLSAYEPLPWLYDVDFPVDYDQFSRNLFNLEAEAFYYGALVAKALQERLNYVPLGVYDVLVNRLRELESKFVCIIDPEIGAPPIFKVLEDFFYETNAYQKRWRRLYNLQAPEWGLPPVDPCDVDVIHDPELQISTINTQVEIDDPLTGKYLALQFQPLPLPEYFPYREHFQDFRLPLPEFDPPLDPQIRIPPNGED